MSQVPERDKVDRSLGAAREVAEGMSTGEMLTPGTLRDFARVLLHCTEAVVYQIRDADDTQFQLKESIEAATRDFTIAQDGFTAAIEQLAGKRR